MIQFLLGGAVVAALCYGAKEYFGCDDRFVMDDDVELGDDSQKDDPVEQQTFPQNNQNSTVPYFLREQLS